MRWIGPIYLGLILASGLSASARAAALDTMPASEIEALQHRLADDRCYSGPIDGVASAAVAKAIASCPIQDPQLRIETGMHVAPIWRIGVNQACTMAATGSDDKTIRLWSLPDNRLLRTLRMPIGPGNAGKVYALAVSPDGRFVAGGGWDARYDLTKTNSIYVFDTATGALVTRAGALDNVIHRLVFSPDGRWLVATLGNEAGIRIVDTSTWKVMAGDRGYKADSYGAAFGPDGRLFTIAYDGKVRGYGPGPSFVKEHEAPTHGGTKPYSVAVDPGGQFLAVGFDDTTNVDIYDAATLEFRFAADTRGVNNGDLSKVAWRADGGLLFAAGRYQVRGAEGWRDVRLAFDRDGRRIGEPAPLTKNTVSDVQPCGAGFAAASGDPALGLLGPDGRWSHLKVGVAPDLRDKRDQAFLISSDAKQVRFGLEVGAATPVAFDLATSTLSAAPTPAAALTAAITSGLPVADWGNNGHPSFAGKPIRLGSYDLGHTLAIRQDRAGFVLGTAFSLRAFDAKGQETWVRQVPGEVWGVNLSADGRIVVAAFGDGTVRWHRWSDGQEILALFVDKDTRAWVAWTPAGYYAASPGGEDLIGWHLNRGWDQAADFFPASRFRDRFDRPDVVALVLDTLDEGAAVEQANRTSKRHDDTRAVIERLPPVLTILSPADGATVPAGMVEIRYGVRSASDASVDRIETFVNGAKTGTRGLARLDEAVPATLGRAGKGDSTGSVSVPMPAHDAEISLVAYAGGLASDAVKVQLKAAPVGRSVEAFAGPDDVALKPTLYALLIGVTHYDNPSLDLAYPAKDATDLAEAFKSQKGRLYKDVEVKVLTDKDATSIAVKRGLLWLRKQTTSRDLAIVFAAGHGTTDAKGKFWFLTSYADPDELSVTAVSRDDISDILFDLPGKKLLFLDACHSGAALNAGARGAGQGATDVTAALNDFSQAEGGVVAYAASTGHEFSFERPEWGHGAFTKALIEAIGEGKADLLHKGTITTATLDAFLEDRVKELTNGQQHPVMTRPKTVPDFPVAMSR